MKVCFLAGTLGRGGAEKQLLYMLKALKEEGISTRVLCLTKGESYESEIESLGIEVEWIGNSGNKGLRLWQIVKSLKKQPADVLQSSHFYTNLYVGIAGKILGIPSIGAIRSDLTSELAAHKLLGGWQISLPQHLIANSMIACERAVERRIDSRKIDFVPNAIDVKSENRKGSKPDGSPLKILFVGRLGKEKRPELFIKLAAVLIKRLPDKNLHFQIVGDGARRAELEKLAEDLKLTGENLSFLGIRTDMDEIYRQADALILTSEYEGTPNVLLEAMAFGLPIIAARVGGVLEVVDETRALLFDKDDEAGLIEATKKLILNAGLREALGVSGYQYVSQNRSLDNLQKQLIKVYSKLISE